MRVSFEFELGRKLAAMNAAKPIAVPNGSSISAKAMPPMLPGVGTPEPAQLGASATAPPTSTPAGIGGQAPLNSLPQNPAASSPLGKQMSPRNPVSSSLLGSM